MISIEKYYRDELVFIKIHFYGKQRNDVSAKSLPNDLTIYLQNIYVFTDLLKYILYVKNIFEDYQEDFFSIQIINKEFSLYVDFVKNKLRLYKKVINNYEIAFCSDSNDKISVNMINFDLQDFINSNDLKLNLTEEFNNVNFLLTKHLNQEQSLQLRNNYNV